MPDLPLHNFHIYEEQGRNSYHLMSHLCSHNIFLWRQNYYKGDKQLVQQSQANGNYK